MSRVVRLTPTIESARPATAKPPPKLVKGHEERGAFQPTAVQPARFYHWVVRPQSATAARREALITRIQHFFKESDGTYGYRRIHADLAAEQTECSPELVRQLMRQIGLVACQPRLFRITTEADAKAAANMPDLVKRDFTADRPGGKFVGDITYSAQSAVMCSSVGGPRRGW